MALYIHKYIHAYAYAYAATKKNEGLLHSHTRILMRYVHKGD